MKKSFLGILVCITVLFSSCLGDNESTYTGGVDFAVMQQTETGSLYAISAVTGFKFSWDGIDKYAVGDAMALSSYHLNFGNSNSSVVKADYVNISQSFPVDGQLRVTSGVADTISNTKNEIALTNLTVLAQQKVAAWLNDKWEISYTYDKKEGEVYNLKFVYDATKQKLKGKDLPKNTVIVDVIIDKVGSAIGSNSEKKTQVVVVNFNTLRTVITPSDLTEAVDMTIQFRLSKKGTNSIYDNTNEFGGYLYYDAKK